MLLLREKGVTKRRWLYHCSLNLEYDEKQRARFVFAENLGLMI